MLCSGMSAQCCPVLHKHHFHVRIASVPGWMASHLPSELLLRHVATVGLGTVDWI